MLDRLLTGFLGCRRGNIAVISAVTFPVLLGLTGLAAEYGNALQYKLQAQRTADAAAFAAATIYNANNDANAPTLVANAVAALNGTGSASVTTSLVTSPSGSGNQAVRVVVSMQAPVYLTRLLAPNTTYVPISSTAYAEIKGGAPGCVVALKATGTGVTLSGGTSLSAAGCAVQSNNTVTVPCGTTITTIAVNYNSAAAPSQPCNGITAPAGKSLSIKKVASIDPLAGDAGVATATSRIATVAALTNPSAPATSGSGPTDFGWAAAPTLPAGCSASRSGSVWTLTCIGDGPFNMGNITMGGGLTLNFNLTGSPTAVYNLLSVTTQGTAAFGPGTYNIRQGLTTEGTATFGAGTFNIGAATTNCLSNSVGAGYSICLDSGTLTFGGPSAFTLQGGVAVDGGTSLTMGSGTSNSYSIGRSAKGNSLYANGGADTYLADSVGTNFQAAGNINLVGGGSCTRLPVAPQHDINGFLLTAGGTILGSGVYTVNGHMGLGASNGGDVTCWGSTVGLSAADVTIVLSGVSTNTSGCVGQVFCVGAGYGHVTLTAPSTGPLAKLAVVGPQSVSVTGGATFQEGSSGTTISGAFYFPNGPISLSGAASVGSGAGQCLQLIGTQVTLAGGSTAATACISGNGSANASVVLVG